MLSYFCTLSPPWGELFLKQKKPKLFHKQRKAFPQVNHPWILSEIPWYLSSWYVDNLLDRQNYLDKPNLLHPKNPLLQMTKKMVTLTLILRGGVATFSLHSRIWYFSFLLCRIKLVNVPSMMLCYTFINWRQMQPSVCVFLVFKSRGAAKDSWRKTLPLCSGGDLEHVVRRARSGW